jgi:hypothetical protein
MVQKQFDNLEETSLTSKMKWAHRFLTDRLVPLDQTETEIDRSPDSEYLDRLLFAIKIELSSVDPSDTRNEGRRSHPMTPQQVTRVREDGDDFAEKIDVDALLIELLSDLLFLPKQRSFMQPRQRHIELQHPLD